jgi:LPS sulfotransferase NodH
MGINRPFFLRPEVTPFVILFIERDGSTYMTSMLDSHPAIEMVYERFSVMVQRGTNATEQLAWARHYFTPPAVGRRAAVGFKTKLVDVLDPDGFAALLQERECRVIRMQRRNRVKAVISRINARRLYEATGKWNLYDKSDRMPPMDVDPGEFLDFLNEREQAEQELDHYVARIDRPTLAISYEDLLVDRDAVLASVFSFLGVPQRPVVEKTMKHTRDDLRTVVTNFDELRESVAETPYASMFDEVLVPLR